MATAARSNPLEPPLDFRALYDRFNASVTGIDCGAMCAPHNETGKPFCCDICHAVPAVYRPEWAFLQEHTGLWQPYTGAECPADPGEAAALWADTPDNMILLACLGPDRCQRPYRAISCRQFPFFPYITTGGDFIGLAYEWAFEDTCWVISHLDQVIGEYRQEFIAFYDLLFERWPLELKGYALLSEEMREHFSGQRRRIPLLHRQGGACKISPFSERMQQVALERLPKFGFYRSAKRHRGHH